MLHSHILSGAGYLPQSPETVIILGAGVAGLVTAYELERLGHQVEILEASDRIGGRVCTHRFGDGPDSPFVELGAMRLRVDHELTMRYITELGLLDDLREFQTLFSDDDNLMNIQDRGYLRVREVPTMLVAKLADQLADRHYHPRTLLFGAWLQAYLSAVVPNEFDDAPGVTASLLDLVDRIDLAPYLHRDESRVDLHRVVADHPHLRTLAFRGRERLLDDVLDETSQGLLRLRGGMDRLIGRLAEQITGPIRLGHEVTGLTVRGSGVAVRVRQGDVITERQTDRVVCTIPFPVLRKLRLKGFDDSKLDAIQETRYWPATKIALHCREPFWIKEGITGGASFTGGLVRQTYYPPVEHDPSLGAALLASYTIGPDSENLAKLDPAALRQRVLREVRSMHPRLAEPGMVLGAVSRAWGEYPWAQGAANIRWGQDEATRRAEQWAAARPQGGLFFAGEHCSAKPAWIEGAIESALDVVHDFALPGPRSADGALSRLRDAQ